MSLKSQSPYLQWNEQRRNVVLREIITPLISVCTALLVVSIILFFLNANLIVAFKATLRGALGSVNNIGTTLAKTTPLLLAGIGIAFALRANLFNIGAEGQIYMGGLACTWVILTFSLTGLVGLMSGILAGILGGALWCWIAGWLYAKRGVSEVITTLLMNYIAINLVLWAVSDPMHAPQATFPRSEHIPESSLLPILLPHTQGHIGIIIGVLLAVIFSIVLSYTVFGFRVKALQEGGGTPRYAGIHVARITMTTLAISGGMAGLAGAIEVLGVHRYLVEGFSPGYGFDAIAVALLSRGNPIAVIPTALFFGILRSGANAMQRATGVPASMVFVIQGLTILCVIAGYSIETLLRRKRAIEKMREAKALVVANGEIA
jgi:simple sugar transport system permease protein